MARKIEQGVVPDTRSTSPFQPVDDEFRTRLEEEDDELSKEEERFEEAEPDDEELADTEIAEILEAANQLVINPESEEYRALLMALADADDMVGVYIKEAGIVPLLTAEEEISLSRRAALYLPIKQALAEIKREFGEKSQAYRDALEEMTPQLHQAKEAWDHLATANLRLVISVAKRYLNQGLPFLDLIQEGNLGLMKGVQKYDPTRGNRFSTYATWWIRQKVTRALAEQSRTIRIPIHMGERLRRVQRTAQALEQQLGRRPHLTEIAEELNLSMDDLTKIIEAGQVQPSSYNEPVGEDHEDEKGDFLVSAEALTTEEAANHNVLKEVIEKILVELENSPLETEQRYAFVIRWRFGLLAERYGEESTLQEIADQIGVSRERIRQLERPAFQAMVRIGRKYGLEGFVDWEIPREKKKKYI